MIKSGRVVVVVVVVGVVGAYVGSVDEALVSIGGTVVGVESDDGESFPCEPPLLDSYGNENNETYHWNGDSGNFFHYFRYHFGYSESVKFKFIIFIVMIIMIMLSVKKYRETSRFI